MFLPRAMALASLCLLGLGSDPPVADAGFAGGYRSICRTLFGHRCGRLPRDG